MDSLFQTVAVFVISLSALLFLGPILVVIGLIDKVDIGPLKLNLTRKSKGVRSAIALTGLATWLVLYLPLVFLAFKAVRMMPEPPRAIGETQTPLAVANPLAVPVGEDIFQISSQHGWQDTRIRYEVGEKIEIYVVTGTWTRWPDNAPVSNGQGNQDYVCGDRMLPSKCSEPLPDSPAGALIGKIGDMVFEIGTGIIIQSGDEGNLFLRMNDGDDGLYDNQGSLLVKIVR